jgi:hypothetical protein
VSAPVVLVRFSRVVSATFETGVCVGVLNEKVGARLAATPTNDELAVLANGPLGAVPVGQWSAGGR